MIVRLQMDMLAPSNIMIYGAPHLWPLMVVLPMSIDIVSYGLRVIIDPGSNVHTPKWNHRMHRRDLALFPGACEDSVRVPNDRPFQQVN